MPMRTALLCGLSTAWTSDETEKIKRGMKEGTEQPRPAVVPRRHIRCSPTTHVAEIGNSLEISIKKVLVVSYSNSFNFD
jgi:hypothetical protein